MSGAWDQVHVFPRPVKIWGPVDGRGHAMFGWPMEEEAKLEFTITVIGVEKTAASRRRNWGRWTAALAARPKMWVCNSFLDPRTEPFRPMPMQLRV